LLSSLGDAGLEQRSGHHRHALVLRSMSLENVPTPSVSARADNGPHVTPEMATTVRSVRFIMVAILLLSPAHGSEAAEARSTVDIDGAGLAGGTRPRAAAVEGSRAAPGATRDARTEVTGTAEVEEVLACG
jgi:hypothetical protein